jgi:hypothetical protein
MGRRSERRIEILPALFLWLAQMGLMGIIRRLSSRDPALSWGEKDQQVKSLGLIQTFGRLIRLFMFG